MISVIIPYRNAAATLDRAIRSVVEQTEGEWELLLVDNNSTDGGAQAAAAWQARYPARITCLRETRPGAPHARNCGLAAARGELVQFLDADDELLPTKTAHQLRLMKRYSNGPIGGGYYYHDLRGWIREIRPSEESTWVSLTAGRIGITSSMLFRRAEVEAVGGWDPTLAGSQEYDLLFRLAKAGYLPRPDPALLTRVYQQPGSIGRSDRAVQLRAVYDLRARIHDYLATEQTALFKQEQTPLDYHLFKSIRDLGVGEGVPIFHRHFPTGYHLPAEAPIGRLYAAVYRMLGFRVAGLVWAVWRKVVKSN